jgi:hypothetical protein
MLSNRNLNKLKNENNKENFMDGIGDADVVGGLHQEKQRKTDALVQV